MDSRFYKETDVNEKSHMTAKEIWDRDTDKNLLCEQLNIPLLRIKEYDWLTDKEAEQNRIIEFLKC